MLHQRINELKALLMEYGHLAELTLDKSIRGLAEKEPLILTEILREDEPKANHFECDLDELAINLIARYQPEAVDLRSILMILRINNDLERVVDHVCNIAESSLALIEQPLDSVREELTQIAQVSKSMFKDSLVSFWQVDSALAEDVCRKDDVVDELTLRIIKKSADLMSHHPGLVESSLHAIRIAHNFERIADLSTNISEDVVFMVDGRVIKHHHEESTDKQ